MQNSGQSGVERGVHIVHIVWQPRGTVLYNPTRSLRVEELMELSAELIGRDNSAYDLVVCLIELGELEKAITVLEVSGVTTV